MKYDRFSGIDLWCAEQVRVALVIHHFQEGVISIGTASQLAYVPRVELECLLVDMGLPTVRYDLADYEQDTLSLTEMGRRRGAA